jgi:hypothetical protein
MCSADLNMGTISGTTHIKTIFSFSPGKGKHFIRNALCSSDDYVIQLSHILHFSSTNYVFYNLPEEKIWGFIQKFPDWVDNEINNSNNKHSLRSNTKVYGSKTH